MSATAPHTNPTQADAILRHLQEGHTITPKDARSLCGCDRLGARIFELRRRGVPIRSSRRTLPGKKYVAEYCLDPLDPETARAAAPP
jgi:hypothetical protein